MPLIHSPKFLEAQQRERERSAIELIAQGLISVPLSARQQKAYEDAVLYAAEIDAQERSYFEQMPARIAAENQRVLADLNAGRLYLANEHGGSAPTIHFASCASVRHQVDRDVAHEIELVHADHFEGSWHAGVGSDFVAKWPRLMTLEEIEQLRAYRACQRCNPDTKERRKSPTSSPKPSKLSSIGIDRIGRQYGTVAGEPLGTLQSYTVSENLIVLHCTERDHQGPRDGLVVLLPRS